MAENNTTNQNFTAEEKSSLTVSDIWALVWGHKWWYLISLALFLALGAYYLYKTPKQYERSIKVVIDGEHIGHIKAGSCAHLLKVIREGRIHKISCKIQLINIKNGMANAIP